MVKVGYDHPEKAKRVRWRTIGDSVDFDFFGEWLPDLPIAEDDREAIRRRLAADRERKRK